MFERIFPHRTQALLDRVSLIIANEDFYLAGAAASLFKLGIESQRIWTFLRNHPLTRELSSENFERLRRGLK